MKVGMVLEVFLGKHAGFCFGVNLAMETVEKNENKKLATYGPIIHNQEVINKLNKKGVKVIENFDNIIDETVVIRSHGVPPEVYNQMEENNIKYIDCTCPYVKKIQRIAYRSNDKNNEVIIIGSKVHPEVISIKGFAGNRVIILEEPEDVSSVKFELTKEYTVVVQTTFIREKFENIVKKIQELGINVKIYDTICSATSDRQKEAEELSKIMDCIIVIGDTKSSNTNKLFEISKKNCKKTYLIQTIKDLELNNFSSSDKIGIIAGASTPPDIIKEVFFTMSELDNNDKSFEEMLNESFISLHTGDVVTGTVISVSKGEVSVNLGYKSDGIISKDEFSEDPLVNPEEYVKEGDQVRVLVVRVNDGEGNVLLSKKRVDSQLKIDELESYFIEQNPIKGRIIDTVKGGLIALINNVRVFVPSSQLSNKFVENVSEFKGKEFNFNILEFDRSKRRIVAGRKALAVKEESEVKDKILNSLEVGSRIEGTVSRIVDFGAFVDLGGVDGLIHISEISWSRVKHVKDILAEGDKVTVTILNIDKENGKVSLTMKDEKDSPWKNAMQKLSVGSIVDGKVVRMVKFGAFVELFPGIDGLIHISQISSKHVTKPENELKIGQIVKVKIIEIDEDNKRISLSKKEADGINTEEEAQ